MSLLLLRLKPAEMDNVRQHHKIPSDWARKSLIYVSMPEKWLLAPTDMGWKYLPYDVIKSDVEWDNLRYSGWKTALIPNWGSSAFSSLPQQQMNENDSALVFYGSLSTSFFIKYRSSAVKCPGLFMYQKLSHVTSLIHRYVHAFFYKNQ